MEVFLILGVQDKKLWICDTRVWTTDEYLVMFVTVKNLVRIRAVVSIICMFLYFACLPGIYAKNQAFGVFRPPQYGDQHQRDIQVAETRNNHVTDR